MKAIYIGIISKDKDSDYGIHFEDFPGCISAASNKDELLNMATEALQAHIDLMKEHNDAIPSAPKFAELLLYKNDKDVLFIQVEI